MILTEADIPNYLPTTELSGDAFRFEAQQAQLLAESSQGAHRPLEIAQFIEVTNMPVTGNVLLSRLPVLDSPAIVVEVRAHQDAPFGLLTTTAEWVTQDSGSYTVDYSRGEIHLEQFASTPPEVSYSGSPTTNPYRRRKRVLSNAIAPQVRITYSTGFDFQAEPESAEVQEIKRAIAGIVWQREQTKGLRSGIKSYQLEGFYKVDYDTLTGRADADSSYSLFDEYLRVLRKYAPRGFVT